MTVAVPVARSRQAGVTLVEIILALACAGVLVVGIAHMLARNNEGLSLATLAGRMAQVRSASDAYIKDNFLMLEYDTRRGPVAVQIPALIREHYLPDGFRSDNEYQQQMQVYVRQRASGILESLVVATGGRPMPPQDGGQVALLLKGAGGYVAPGSAIAVGTKGNWQLRLADFVPPDFPTPSGAAVVYAMNYHQSGPTGALMRDATGNPADNRMGTDLDMAQHQILNVSGLKLGDTYINKRSVERINSLDGISCNPGEALTKYDDNIYCAPVSSIPSGVISAFTTPCPSGWGAVSDFAGRVLVASGNGYNEGDTGGSETVTLTTDQMPSHSHKVAVLSDTRTAINNSKDSPIAHHGQYGDSPQYILTAGNGSDWVGPSSEVGGNLPFDNRQPYYVVNYCRKQ